MTQPHVTATSDPPAATQVTLCTPPAPGAVALLQLRGPHAGAALRALTGQTDWQPHRIRLVDFAQLDRGLAVLGAEDWVQLMPHGGPLIVARLLEHLARQGVTLASELPPHELYPEAANPFEAHWLSAAAQVSSAAGLNQLLAQPTLWREALQEGSWRAQRDAILARSRRWQRLLHPPTVALVGCANVGKSTLTNRLLGRSASVVADLPGTTRDWVGHVADLAGVAVHWLDTPGLRADADALERQAVALAQQAWAAADLLIAVRDPEHDWPAAGDLPHTPGLWVWNQCDRLLPPESPPESPPAAGAAGPGAKPTSPLAVSATLGTGLDQLWLHAVAALGLADCRQPALWAFCPELSAALEANDAAALHALLPMV